VKRSALRSRPKPKGYDLDAAGHFFAATVHRKAVCAGCGSRRGLEAHHGLPKAAIEDFARSERLSQEERNRLLWDPRNGVALCQRCHERHTTAFSRLSRAKLPKRVWAFALELNAMATRQGKEWATVRLEREYPA
jgi:5-methylcytosine-specific restriction endonuclease McrA